MATIQKRKNKNRTISYRVMIRPSDGLPAMYKTFPTFEEAKDWAAIEECNRRQGIYFPEKLKKKHTVAELIDLYTEALPHLGVKSAEDILRHLTWWKAKIGKYTLNHLNSDLIKKQRQELLDEVSLTSLEHRCRRVQLSLSIYDVLPDSFPTGRCWS
jgi:hypothetical protein